eukprot:7018290-Prymnesium_polylepis.1
MAHSSREPAEALDSSPCEAAALGTSRAAARAGGGRRLRGRDATNRHPRRLQLPTEVFGCHLA